MNVQRPNECKRFVARAVKAFGRLDVVVNNAAYQMEQESILDITPRHKRVEIGSTWYAPDVWGTRVNPECKLLLLEHAFEVLGVNRVALVTDRLNERSQRAIAKLGALREGVLRAHMVSQGGRVRDSVVFGITTAEWPQVRAGLLARLEKTEED